MNNYNINLAKAANLTAILMKLAGAYERIAKSGYSDAFVLFPFLFLRRVDCILSDKVKAMADYYQANKDVLSKEELVVGLKQISGSEFYNVSGLSLSSLVENSKEIAINMHYYVEGFDDSIKNILFAFNFKHSIEALNSKHILSNIIDDFIAMNFGEGAFPSKNIWKDFNRISYFISGLNFSFNPYSTPESVSKLMCAMLFGDYEHNLRVDQKLSSIYDTTCGIGGSLYTTKNYFDNVVCKNNTCHSYLSLYGQEINSKSCAVAKSVALLSGMDESNFKIGDSLLDDKFKDEKFDLIIIDGPQGFIDYPPIKSSTYSRTNIWNLIPNNLADEFIIIIDDYDRIGEQNTIKHVEELLNKENIKFDKCITKGLKTQCIILTEKYKFVKWF